MNGLEGASRSSISSLKGSIVEELHEKCESFTELGAKGNRPVTIEDNHGSVSVDDVSKKGDVDGMNPCGILPNNCLPCLTSTVPQVDKRRALSPGPPSMRKKAALRLSFKWKTIEGQLAPTLCE